MKQRNFGLDIVRAMAILLVLVNHSINYFASFPISQPIGDICGIYGVEIFFVLSGYLIGQIYFRDVLPNISKHSIRTFYMRRWLRTLPLYYLLLTIFVVIGIIQTHSWDFHFFHYLFLQNFISHGLDFFSVTWSLAVEEWFYLLLPLFALFFLKHASSSLDKQLKILTITIVAIIFIKLILLSFIYMPYESVRRVIPFRFDSLLIGVLLAGIKFGKKRIFYELQKPSHVAALAAVLCIALFTQYIYYTRGQLDISHFAKIFSLPIMSLLLASLLPFMEASTAINFNLVKVSITKHLFTWLSLLSYSIYLVHLEVYDLSRTLLRNRLPPIGILTIALAITFGISFLLYTYFEKPIMDKRKNFG